MNDADTPTGDSAQAVKPPGKIILRDYQTCVNCEVDAARAAGHRRILVCMPTGAGKTSCFCEIIRQEVAAGRTVLVLVHRRELLQQAVRRLYAAGIDAAIIAAGQPSRPGVAVQVAMVQTLYGRAVRSSAISLPPADVIVVDEAHHVIAGTWQKIVARYPDAVLIGWTATPVRGDNRGFGDMFDVLIQGPSIPSLIAVGHLVRPKVWVPHIPNLKGVKSTGGDYNEKQLAERMDRQEITGDIPVHYLRHAAGLCTVVFAITRSHGVHIRDALLRAGVMAEYLDGSTPVEERDAILARLASGKTEVVVNVGVLVEGWDLPQLRCIILARPTKSFGLYLQIIGRGLRPAPGKSHCIILDHAGATLLHGLVDHEPIPWSLSPDRAIDHKSSSSKGVGVSPKLAACPECTAVYWPGKPCGACGWRPRPRSKPVEAHDGDLVEFGRDGGTKRIGPTEAERAAWHGMLATIAMERGYKSGWAAYKFFERFKGWPPRRQPAPIEPTPECRAWVKSRAIAWAKSQQRQAGAQ